MLEKQNTMSLKTNFFIEVVMECQPVLITELLFCIYLETFSAGKVSLTIIINIFSTVFCTIIVSIKQHARSWVLQV